MNSYSLTASSSSSSSRSEVHAMIPNICIKRPTDLVHSTISCSLSRSNLKPPSSPSSPIQSVTTQILDDESVYAQIVCHPQATRKKHVQNTNRRTARKPPAWSKLYSQYNRLSGTHSQCGYIKTVSRQIDMQSVVLLDWDDTIFPTTAFSILQQQSLQRNFFRFIDSAYHKHRVLAALVAVIDKCIADTFNFIMAQIQTNHCAVFIVSNATSKWLHDCLNASKVISNLPSVQKLKRAINDESVPLSLISAKSEYMATYPLSYKANADSSKLGVLCKQSAFVKYLNALKTKHVQSSSEHRRPCKTTIFCVYCIGDDVAEMKAAKIAMKRVFNQQQYLLIRHKLEVDRSNAKYALQSVLANMHSFSACCWDRGSVISMLLQYKCGRMVYDTLID